MKASYTDPATDERIACELFVAASGAASYTCAESLLVSYVPFGTPWCTKSFKVEPLHAAHQLPI